MEARALVGRDRELAAFEAAWSGVQRGQRALLVLSGEPGIGKTRLLETLATRAVAQGGHAVWGRMWEVGLTPAFWPFIQVLAALATPDQPAPALASLEERADAGARLLRFGEVAQFLLRRSQQQPLAILLDDLHVADPSSLQLLMFLLPQLLHARVLFAVAARDTDARPEIAAALGRILRGAERLPLAPLDPGSVAQLVGERADSGRVYALSEGNPLFIEELLASVRDAGRLQLPRLSSVRALMRERVSSLAPEAQGALAAACVLGREFRGQVVAHMLGSGLEPVRALGMLIMTGPDHYRFSHALVAEAIADELDAAERARLHLRAAHALERHAGEDTSAIAHHLLAAGHLAAEAAVVAAERAARKCLAQLAFEDAEALLERALQALSLAEPQASLRRAGLMCLRAEALQHASRHAAAAALCDDAAQLTRALASGQAAEAAELLARIALARGLEMRFGHTDPILCALLREALDELGERNLALRAKLLARLAAAEQPASDPREPMARALAAIELAAQLPAADRLDVMYVASAALVEYLDPHALERIQHEVLALARGRDRGISAHTRLRLCFNALERVDRPGFDAAVEAFAAEAHALGLPRWTRQVHMLTALTALLEGRFDAAQLAAAEYERSSQALGDASAAFLVDVHRVMFAWVSTRPQDAGPSARAAQYAPGRAAISAWLAVQDTDRERARGALAELGERIPIDPDLGAMVACATAFIGEPVAAQRALRAIEAKSGRIVVAAMVGCSVMELYDRLLLLLSAAARRWDDIDVYAERALGVAARLGSPVWSARVRADWADALGQRNRAGDAARARELRAAALAEAERLGMPGLIQRCRAPKAETPADVGLQLTRSGELWTLTGLGEAVHVKTSRGMEWLARLIAEPGRELHVLELVGAPAAVSGDSGPLLDTQARTAYRERMRELVAQREQAEAQADLGRAERVAAELEALTGELERAFGLGGRERRAGVASERARSNVQRRIAHALGQVRTASPRLADHLQASVRTGTYCVYAP